MAGPEAYPLVLRINPGMAVRPPLAWELELLEACLRAIPKFLARQANARPNDHPRLFRRVDAGAVMAEVNKGLLEIKVPNSCRTDCQSVRDFARTDWQSVLHPNRNIILWQFAKAAP